MNFDFSDEQKQLQDQARRYLADKCPPSAVRAVLEGGHWAYFGIYCLLFAAVVFVAAWSGL